MVVRRVVRWVGRAVDAAGRADWKGILGGELVVDGTRLDSVTQNDLGQQTPTQLRLIGQL